MSIRAIVWAFEQECPSPAAKLVLIKLADHCNEEGECWPSQGRIAADTGLSRETVNRQIPRLVASGLITAQQRVNGIGQLPNRYFLRCDWRSHPPVISGHTPCDDRSHPPVISGHTEPLRENLQKNRQTLSGHFEKFWSLYPSRGASANPKKPARQAFERAIAKGADPELIVDAAERFRAQFKATGKDPQFVPQAVTWLNQERFSDEPAPNANADRFTGPKRPQTEAEKEQLLAKLSSQTEALR